MNEEKKSRMSQDSYENINLISRKVKLLFKDPNMRDMLETKLGLNQLLLKGMLENNDSVDNSFLDKLFKLTATANDKIDSFKNPEGIRSNKNIFDSDTMGKILGSKINHNDKIDKLFEVVNSGLKKEESRIYMKDEYGTSAKIEKMEKQNELILSGDRAYSPNHILTIYDDDTKENFELEISGIDGGFPRLVMNNETKKALEKLKLDSEDINYMMNRLQNGVDINDSLREVYQNKELGIGNELALNIREKYNLDNESMETMITIMNEKFGVSSKANSNLNDPIVKSKIDFMDIYLGSSRRVNKLKDIIDAPTPFKKND